MSESTRPTNIKYPTLAGPRLFPKFEPRDTIAVSSKAFVLSTLFGLNVAAIKGNLGPYRSVFGGIRANAHHVFIFGAVGTTYTFVEAVTANIRGEESPFNSFLGGAAAGAILGASFGNVAKSFGGALLVGSILAVSEWSGGIQGLGREQAIAGSSAEVVKIDDGERQGFWDVVHRRPLSQTVEQLGDLAKPLK